MPDIKQSHPDAFKQLNLNIQQLQGYEGRVGWFDDGQSSYPDGTPVAYVAAIQELGYGPIPPRPFMRPAAEDNQEQWKKVAAGAARKIVAGEITGQDGMELIALQAESDVRTAIEDVNAPPLSPITLWARYYRRQGKKVTGSTIGEIAEKLASGELSHAGPPGVSTKPLNDTGLMIATLKSQVVST